MIFKLFAAQIANSIRLISLLRASVSLRKSSFAALTSNRIALNFPA